MLERRRHPNYPHLKPKELEEIDAHCRNPADETLKERWERNLKNTQINYTRVSGECHGRTIWVLVVNFLTDELSSLQRHYVGPNNSGISLARLIGCPAYARAQNAVYMFYTKRSLMSGTSEIQRGSVFLFRVFLKK
jgi:hypothetical protein